MEDWILSQVMMNEHTAPRIGMEETGVKSGYAEWESNTANGTKKRKMGETGSDYTL